MSYENVVACLPLFHGKNRGASHRRR
jgi:hypothetical protein